METFFSFIVCVDNEVEILEFLHRRYHSIDLIMQMDVKTFIKFIQTGKEKEREERLHRQWTSMLPAMSKQELKYVSFEDYINQCTGKNIDLRSSEEIIKELETLHGRKLV